MNTKKLEKVVTKTGVILLLFMTFVGVIFVFDVAFDLDLFNDTMKNTAGILGGIIMVFIVSSILVSLMLNVSRMANSIEGIFESKSNLKDIDKMKDEVKVSDASIRNLTDYLNQLNILIKEEKQNIVGTKRKNEIISLISRLTLSKEFSIIVLEKYSENFNSSLIDDLKGLTSNYSSIKDYLNVFIEFEIVESEHPHNLV